MTRAMNMDDLRDHLEIMLGATIRSVTVQRLDLVNDSTWVDVRYSVPRSPARLAALDTTPQAERIETAR